MSNQLAAACCCLVLPAVLIACCFDNGDCDNLTVEECEALGGTPQGVGTDCAKADCEPKGPCDYCQCHAGEVPDVVQITWSGFAVEDCCFLAGDLLGPFSAPVEHAGFNSQVCGPSNEVACRWVPLPSHEHILTGCETNSTHELAFSVHNAEIVVDFDGSGETVWTSRIHLILVGAFGVHLNIIYIRPCEGPNDIDPRGEYAFHSSAYGGNPGECETVITGGMVVID